MIVHVPDPHPGRCESYRSKVHSDGYVEQVRCLNYEFERHVCDFPPFSHLVGTATGGVYSTTPATPQPWVRPQTT